MGNESEQDNKICEKCKGMGMVKEADGTCHTCWDCMMAGKLNQHSEKLPETRIKL